MAKRTLEPMAANGTVRSRIDEVAALVEVGEDPRSLAVDQAQGILKEVRAIYRAVMVDAGHDAKEVDNLAKKLNDAGRRSAPWRAFSKKVAGRPQDGNDGNRAKRWGLPLEHKYYADEVTATLVEIKYFLELLSMQNAPDTGSDDLTNAFMPWLVEHRVRPGAYIEPIQLIPIDLPEILHHRRRITSGHLVPLDRGGRHEPSNTFLIYSRSNQMQGNMTLDELLSVAQTLVRRHQENGTFPASPQMPPEDLVHGAKSAADS
jgi:hypothetical protein